MPNDDFAYDAVSATAAAVVVGVATAVDVAVVPALGAVAGNGADVAAVVDVAVEADGPFPAATAVCAGWPFSGPTFSFSALVALGFLGAPVPRARPRPLPAAVVDPAFDVAAEGAADEDSAAFAASVACVRPFAAAAVVRPPRPRPLPLPRADVDVLRGGQ